jgi:predicted metal-dependent peptidase
MPVVPLLPEFDRARRLSLSYLQETELTKPELDEYIKARAALLWAARFFGVLFLNKAVVKFVRNSPKCPTLMTDDKCIVVNIDYFIKLDIGERVFALCHEVAHMIYAHCQLGWEAQQRGYVQVNTGATQLAPDVPPGCLPYIPALMNIAQDFMINAALIESNVGKFNKNWLYLEKYKGNSSSIDIYADLFKNAKKSGGKGSGQPGGAGEGGMTISLPEGTGTERFDAHAEPGEFGGQDPAKASSDREQQQAEWKMAVAEAAQAARMAGQMPAGLERLVNDIIKPTVDWKEKIIGCFARSLGGGGWDWKRADRDWINRSPKRIYMPARSGKGCGTVVVCGDTSGSITGEEMKLVLGCIVGILEEARPQRLVLLWCDTAVTHDGDYDDPSDLLSRNKPVGGGGTKFEPAFEWCEENDIKPDTFVYVTDMYGSFPQHAPDYPVIWASISQVLNAPFGEVVEIPR